MDKVQNTFELLVEEINKLQGNYQTLKSKSVATQLEIGQVLEALTPKLLTYAEVLKERIIKMDGELKQIREKEIQKIQKETLIEDS